MANDDVTQRGEMVALKIAVRALMQRLYETDPVASSEVRGRITKEIHGHTSQDEKKAALDLCTRYLFQVD